MRHRNIMIPCLTACLLLLLFAGMMLTGNRHSEVTNPEFFLSFTVRTDSGEEIIRSWKNPDGVQYIFLPSYARMENLTAAVDGTLIIVGDSQLSEMTGCGNLAPDILYPFSATRDGKTHEGVLMFVQSGNLPTVYIDTQSGSMEYIHREKENTENGAIRVYEADGFLSYSGAMTLKGRGNSSWGAEKKPYNITLEGEADLLEMGNAAKWVLLSEGYNAAVIRNKIVYDFARAANLAYSPECRWVDLYLNGEYAGLYELSEKNEIHPERVNISLENGGFLVSLEYESRLMEQKYPYIRTDSGQALRVRAGTSELQTLQQHWQSVENAILSRDGIDPVSGMHWSELIDLDSWARKYLLEEIFGNVDAGSLSQFYYVDGNDRNKKVYAGPVWDYDFAMGGEDVWLKPYSDYFVMNRAWINDEVYTPWFPALYRQEEFLVRVKELYVLEFLPLLRELVGEGIRNDWETVQAASKMDSVRWNTDWNAVVHEPVYIKEFLEKRIAFLSDLWISESLYHTVYVDPGRYGINGCFAVKDGDTLPQLPGAEELGGLGWHLVNTDAPFDITQPIHQDIHIYMKKPETSLSVIHYTPLFAMVVFFAGLAGVSFYRNNRNRNRSRHHDTAKSD